MRMNWSRSLPVRYKKLWRFIFEMLLTVEVVDVIARKSRNKCNCKMCRKIKIDLMWEVVRINLTCPVIRISLVYPAVIVSLMYPITRVNLPVIRISVSNSEHLLLVLNALCVFVMFLVCNVLPHSCWFDIFYGVMHHHLTGWLVERRTIDSLRLTQSLCVFSLIYNWLGVCQSQVTCICISRLGHHWFRWWFLPIQHKPSIWANAGRL